MVNPAAAQHSTGCGTEQLWHRSSACAGLPQAQPPPEDSLKLSDQMVSLFEARNDFEANLTVVHVGDQLSRKSLNLLA
jgi:hypothetical protein